MSCCSKIGEILKSIVKALKPILAVALLAFAVYAIWVVGPAALKSVAALSWMPTAVLGMSGTTAGYLALGAALLVDGDAVADIGGELAEGVGEVAGAVIGGIGAGVASSITSSSLFPWLVGGAILWYFWSRDEEKKDKPSVQSAQQEAGRKEDNLSAQSAQQLAGRKASPAPLN
jgi:hypothetical protein